MDDRELGARVKYLSPRIKRNAALSAVFTVTGFVLSAYVRIRYGEALAFLVLIIFFAVGFTFGTSAAKYRKRLKSLVSNNIVRGVLSDTFDLTHYAPGCHIGQRHIKESMLVQQGWNRLSGSDMVEGFYKGVRFRFSDIHLEMVTKSRKGGTTRRTIFKGQWLIIELSKVLPWSLQLRSRLAVGKKAKSSVETENMEFNQRFQIACSDPHTAFYILTPHFMEHILRAKRKANSQTHMNFAGQQVHVALHNGRDLFEPLGKKLFAMDNIAALRSQMQWDANYITGIIDELLLNENLFNKEN
jgi:hypothetical protein